MSEINLEKKLRENSQALGLKSLADFNIKFVEELRENLTLKPGQTPEHQAKLTEIKAELEAGTSIIDLIEAPFKPKKDFQSVRTKSAPTPADLAAEDLKHLGWDFSN